MTRRCPARSSLVALLFAAAAGTALADEPERGAGSFRFLNYNIHHGAGTRGEVDIARTARVIRESAADVATLQEIDRGVRRSGRVDQVRRLEELTGMTVIFGETLSEYQGGRYGLATLTRHPVLRTERHFIPHSPGEEPRMVLEVVVELPGGARLTVLNTHWDDVFTPGLAGRQARAVINLVRKRRGALVLGGDLNVVPQSSAYKALRAVLQDAFPGPRGATYPARAPVIPLDSVM
jgi:endonuclease/exonuclease/phosphatase family metal-dependent hydrolase